MTSPIRSSKINNKLLQRQSGVAIVLVLAIITILSILLVTFLVTIRLERSASKNYSQSAKTRELALGALQQITTDLRSEIISGSTATSVAPFTIYTPKNAQTIVPVRYASGSEPNLIRRSWRDNTAIATAYQGTSYDPATAPVGLASPTASDTPASNKRYVSKTRWDKPKLLTNVANFSVPDWILVTRSGPKRFATVSPSMGNTANADFILGRYAYTIYDEGGLLDINVAGYPTSTGNTPPTLETGGKAAPGYADLTQIPGFSGADAAKATALIDWRNALTKSSYVNYLNQFGATNGFTKVFGDSTGSDNTFLGRLDLLRYAQLKNFNSSLPYLGTFTRESNSPTISPGTDTNLNPDFAKLVFNQKQIRRFPLSRFALLESNPSALSPSQTADILKYFGLSPGAGANATFRYWTYRAATIGTPQAAITAGRDPDLFELVKAAIANNSLGVKLSNDGLINEVAPAAAYSPETNVQQQVARIISNIADQYDADNYPTTIQMGSNDVYGIESLPYFSEMFFKAHFPSGFSSGTGALYSYFELWNPHQGAVPASGPTTVRIVANAGARVMMNYIQVNAVQTTPSDLNNLNGQYKSVNSSYSESPANIAFPTNPITLTNLSQYQANPAICRNSGDSTANVTNLSTAWKLLDVNKPIPATWTGQKFTALLTKNVVPIIEFIDAAGGWHPYTTFAGYATATGTTGIQGGNKPFMNNSNGGGASNNTTLSSVNTSFPKPDPRTFRFRSGVDVAPSATTAFEKTMVPDALPGQAYSQDKSAGSPANPGYLYQNTNTQTVADIDGIIRPGDGYLDTTANPMATGNVSARPIILNRPFRSIAELGYVFRDVPWKSLDLTSDKSADAALLDLFCLEDSEVTAGKVSANTRNASVLAALIAGSNRDSITNASPINGTDASTIATDLSNATTTTPVLNRANLVSAIKQTTVSALYPAIKTQREAAVRALAPNTQTRTWNLLIDVVAQTGRYSTSPASLDSFVVEGERRFWLHLALDRYTGKVIDSQLEAVNE